MTEQHSDPYRERLTVFIVDDDADVRDSLSLLLGLHGYRTSVYASAEDFLLALRPWFAGCLVTDIKMPGLSGLELQQALLTRECALPVVVLTGHGDVPSARAALRARAIDFLLKPFAERDLIEAIETAYTREVRRLADADVGASDDARVATLTRREREVMLLLAEGVTNVEIAKRLAISPRTVEVHKARVLDKLRTPTLADLVRLADRVTSKE
ncbi:MAG: response regulator transcription factor [Burkholderiales bacterium]|nr:response regulator transcription factor [Burkholderiales bacterium]MCC7116097.1 response regulator transcription factor [Burkholderiales bacterium]